MGYFITNGWLWGSAVFSTPKDTLVMNIKSIYFTFRAYWLFTFIALLNLSAIQIVFAQAIDKTTTGSISANSVISAQSKGTAQFRSALSLLVKKDYTAAYNNARGINNDTERRTIQWAAIYYGNGDVDYKSVLRFQKDAPDFASASIYKTRLEQSLVESNLPHSEIIALLGGAMPNTLKGQIALARAYIKDGQSARAGRIIKQIWVNKFLARGEEEAIYKEFGVLLNRADHWKRAQHLLMFDRANGVERIMAQLSPAQKSLAKARIAVSRKSANAQALLNNVDPSMRNDYVFHFANGQLARRQDRLNQAVTHLNKAKGNFPDSAKFWYERRLIVRKALRLNQFQTAYNAAAGYVDGPEGRLVEANFHAGWVALRYLKQAKTASIHFTRQRSMSTLASSITQSNFWLARSLKALGDNSGAKAALSVAAKYDKSFYGQLAREELGLMAVNINKMPSWRGVETTFANRQLVQAVRLLNNNDQGVLAEPLLRRLSYSLQNPGELLLAAREAQSINAHNVAISIAYLAKRRGVLLDLFAFPRDAIPASFRLASVDKAAVFAIARQESRFDIDAKSRSGALGLMQLMPATAKETAKKIGASHSKARLTTDPEYNALLGSTYLAAQLNRYDGSLILAAAAYNAGAGNVNKWLKMFGDPRNSNIDPVSWIERIPFVETRKYVQKIMANYMVYRVREGNKNIKITQALRVIEH